MKIFRFTVNWQFTVIFTSLLLLHSNLASPPPQSERSTSVQGRYIRPSAHGRFDTKCTTTRCLDSPDGGRGDRFDKYGDDEHKVGESVDYKPKDDRGISDDYNSKPKDDYGSTNPGSVHYDRDRNPSSRDEYKPKPPLRVDYNSKPSDRDDYDTKPIDDYRPESPIKVTYEPADRDIRGSNPSVRDEFEPKPSVIDEYKPKPPIRTDYKPGPPISDDHDTKLAVNDGYKPKPPVRDDDYNTKPVINGEHKPKPDLRDDDYDTRPIRGDGYKPPARGDGYKPLVRDDGYKPPARDDGYKPPVRDDGYRPPVRGDGYKPPVRDDGYKPLVRDDGYKPPVRDDGYKPPVRGEGYKPFVRDDGYKQPVGGDDYERNPGISEGYKPKPPIRDDDYDSKPIINDGYKSPDGGDGYKPPVKSDDYETKPVIMEGYKPKPPIRDDDYDAKPIINDEYKPPVRNDEYKPPVSDEGYKPPVRGEGYKPPVRGDGYKPPVRGDGYKPPVRGDGYKPPVEDGEFKPPVGGDGYKPPENDGGYKSTRNGDDYGIKPIITDEYKPPTRDDYKPIGDHVPRPPVRDNYKPVSGGGYHSGYPVKKDDDDYKNAGGDYSSSKNDDEYNEDYKGGDDGRPVPLADDGNCICVPYYQCTEGHIVTDGAGIIDARKRPQHDEEELPLDGKFNPPSCGPFHVCCNTPESSTVKPYEHRCGVRNPSGINSRILSPSNKGEADFGEWPWQAAVLKVEGTVNIFQCGGVLIDKYHVLTVAHCVFHLYKYNDYPLKVRLGEWDTQTTSEFLAHEDYKVSKIAIHPEFKNTSLWNDVAILRLQDPVLFAPHIDTVCLPKYDEMFAGQNCVVTGWGKDSYKGGTFSNVMKEVALQVIDNYGCEEMLRKTRLGRFFQLHEGFVCAGGEHGLDSCKGDGGGPLVCYRKDRSYALAGLVSWGIDCGQPGVPGVYVKIQKYLDWISKTTGVGLEDYWPRH